MTPGTRRTAKMILAVLSLLWLAGSGWLQFSSLAETETKTFASTEVKERMKECDGSFQQRYECKEAIVIETHRTTFWNLTGRVAVVGLPPILAWIAFGLLFPKRLVIPHRQTVAEDPDAWKKRAQEHVKIPTHRGHG